MKQIALMAALTLAAGCGAPQAPDYWAATRAGYGVGGAAAAAQGDHRLAAEAALSPHAAMRPGLHQTRSGAPWLVAHSADFQASGSRLTGGAAAQAALAYKASERKSPYAAKTHMGNNQTRFRIVTIDGSSFAVLFALDLPSQELRATDSAAVKALTNHVAQISGCAVTGAALTQRESGRIHRLAAPVYCS